MNNCPEKIDINFIINGQKISMEVEEGKTILDLKHESEILSDSLECACEGSLACSTCHVIVDPEHYQLTGEITEEEEDMLDLAMGLTKTSRLGCQVRICKNLQGATFTIPSENRNFSYDKADNNC